MPFSLAPAVHVAGGRIDEPLPEGTPEGAEAALAHLSRKHERVYVIDSEGLRANRPDLDLIQRAAKGASVWADTGPRTAQDTMDALVAGAERVTLRWRALAGAGELRESVALAESGAVALGVEFQGDELAGNPKEEASVEMLQRLALELQSPLVVASPAYNRRVAERFASFQSEKWWLGPLTPSDRDDLQRLAFSGAVVPAFTLTERESS